MIHVTHSSNLGRFTLAVSNRVTGPIALQNVNKPTEHQPVVYITLIRGVRVTVWMQEYFVGNKYTIMLD